MKARNRLGRWFGFGATLSALATGGAGCLTRPVGQQPPTTKVNFTTTVSQQAVDKVDLLFTIDNSASMGDKQLILKDAVPNLIEGLLRPKCIDKDNKSVGTLADPNGNKGNNYNCPAGSAPEFSPVTDMHIGVVSSSLGSFGGDVCPDTGRYNDHGHLLALKQGGGSIPAAAPSNFLAWFPQNKDNEDTKRHPPPANPTRDIQTLEAAFQDMVLGVEQNGCGLEAQLESMYHFLVQPDPWKAVTVDGNGQATLGSVKNGDVDVELLQQRADFLRPDSLVAIIMLTDEDDSSADPLAVGGQGWAFMSRNFPSSKVYRGNDPKLGTTAPRGTSTCTDNPGSADCTSCGIRCNTADPACQKIRNDPNCQELGSPPRNGDGTDGYAGYYGPTDDNLNVRFFHMKQRFGIDPQYPIQRYIDGLTKTKVPDREAEHPTQEANGKRNIGAYPTGPEAATALAKCTNPLFAKSLPRQPGEELCLLPASTRSPDLVFFAVVGGVPNRLLHFKPGDPEASRITDADWVKILGRSPQTYDYTGIDPHMIQSITPRAGLPAPSGSKGDNGTDPDNGREWDTNKDDLQYACTFALPTPRVCSNGDTSCDCSPDKNPPLCATDGTTQIRAKAYPTIREFMVARALGENGIAASLCPIQLTNKDAEDYGYKPAVAAIIDRLKNALTTQCLPQKLTRDTATNEVPCLILAQLAEETDKCASFGLSEPPKEILDVFKEQQRQESGNVGDAGLDLSRLPVCVVPQQVVDVGGDCKANTDIKWCYVENGNGNTPAGKCSQAVLFSSGTAQLQGARFSLQCIQQFAAGEAANDPTKQ